MRSRSILLYDGVCGLCNRVVRFALRHDRKDRLRFAPLQSALAKEFLTRHGFDATQLETMAVVVNPDTEQEKVLVRSDAVLVLLSELGGAWGWIAWLGRRVPSPMRDNAYRAVANVRYRVFGKYDSCPLPRAEERGKFLDS